MDLDRLRKMISVAGEHAKLIMIQLQQPLLPTWAYIDGENHLHVVATPWADEREKALATLMMRTKLREVKAQAYSVITEAWRASTPKDWQPGQELPHTPSQDPDRIEIVIAIATDGHHREWKQWRTIRDWNERVITLEEN